MKNIVKFFSMMLVAGSMMLVSCTEKPEDPDNPNNPNEPTVYTVKVNCNDATLGTVTITPLKETYNEGEEVVISATPTQHAKFLNWNGSITENPYTYVVKENMVFTANFEALPDPTWAVTLDGTALNVNGWHGATYYPSYGVWLFQCAQRAEGTSVYLPYFLCGFMGTSASELGLVQAYPPELYNETFYEAGEEQYGDWQFKSLNNINCTKLDITEYVMSVTLSATMYWLTDMVENGAQNADECTTATLALTMSDVVYEPYGGKGMRPSKIRF